MASATSSPPRSVWPAADGFSSKRPPDDDPLTAANLHEAAVLGSLPPGAPAPDLLGIYRAALDGRRHRPPGRPAPDLSPASSDTDQTWALLDQLTSSPAPAPYATAVGTATSTAAALHGWNELVADLAALTGHWHRNARKPAPPGAPGLRAYHTGPPRPVSPSSVTA